MLTRKLWREEEAWRSCSVSSCPVGHRVGQLPRGQALITAPRGPQTGLQFNSSGLDRRSVAGSKCFTPSLNIQNAEAPILQTYGISNFDTGMLWMMHIFLHVICGVLLVQGVIRG